MRRRALLIISLFVPLFIVSCGRSPVERSATKAGSAAQRGSDIKLAILAPGASDFWTIVRAGADKGAKDFGVSCTVRAPSLPGATEQRAIVEDLLAKGIDGLAFAPIDPKNQAGLINRAAELTNLICTDTDAPATKRICYIGTNNYQAGRIAGERLKQVLPGGGKIWVCVGTLDAQNARDRYKGVVDAVKGSNIKVLGVLTDNADLAKAKANAEDALVKTPDLAAFVGLWSYNGPAIADAVKAAGKQGKVKIVCFDEDAATLGAVKDGLVQATVVQRPFEFGYQSVRVLAALARKQNANIPGNKIIDTGVQVVDKTNVDKFRRELRKTTGKD